MKILVRGTNWVGDAVMTIPALRELRRVFPAAEITLHTRGWAEGIFRDASFIDELLTFAPAKSKFKTVFGQSKILRERQFDFAVLLTNSFESALTVKLAQIPRRFGYAKEARNFLLTDAIAIPGWKNERHEIFYYLNLIAAAEKKLSGAETVSTGEPNGRLEISEARKIAAREFLEQNGVDLAKKIVALGVGSHNSRAKRWQTENYARLNDRMQIDLNANVILLGAKDELKIAEEVSRQSKIKPVILSGETSLAEAAAILSVADLLVANDMGLAHVAPAVGTRTLVIFGPTNPLTTQPLNSEIIRREDVECSPCMLRDCPIDHRCMTRISTAEVFAEAAKMLKNECRREK